jgi:Ser/Thr protein kinase RdoA (MazF antagonist)
MDTAADHPYDRLTPDVVIAAVEALGLRCDGRTLALNSYENRVYQIGLEEASPVVVKFYRPDRWSTPAILEEHGFSWELKDAEIPVVPPQRFNEQTLFEYEGFRYAVFERRGGHWPELASRTDREWMGRFLGRIHMVGRRKPFEHRPELSIERFGDLPREFLLEEGWIPPHLTAAYESVTGDLLDLVYEQVQQAGDVASIRLHGDCHPGNVLWTDTGPHFVDLDDCLTGPPIQDLWMLISGNRREMGEQLKQILDGYVQFAEFDHRELVLVESLRSLRMIHYAAWLGARWEDPAFPRAFPWFAEASYWERHVLALREQIAAVEEGPLVLL